MVVELQLSARGLRNTARINKEPNFAFVVGGFYYYVDRLFASFISPLVASELEMDSSMDKYYIDFPNSSNEFQDVINLCYGESVEITEENQLYFLEIGKKLGNDEIVEIALKLKQSHLSLENIVDKLINYHKFSIANEEAISFAAVHFVDIDSAQLMRLDPETIGWIITHKELRVKNEDSLFLFLSMYVNEYGQDSKFLFEYVRAEYLSSESIVTFVSLLSADDMNANLWASIQNRLILDVSPAPEEKRFVDVQMEQHHLRQSEAATKKDLAFDPSRPLDGLFSYLKSSCGGNIVDNGIVSVSSADQSGHLCKVTDPSNTSGGQYSYSVNGAHNRFVSFDLKSKSININKYTIRSYSGSSNQHHLRSWKLLGSHDGILWVEIDSRDDDSHLNAPYAVHTFDVKKNDDHYRFLQLTSDAPDWGGEYYIYIRNIEFFGTLFETE